MLTRLCFPLSTAEGVPLSKTKQKRAMGQESATTDQPPNWDHLSTMDPDVLRRMVALGAVADPRMVRRVTPTFRRMMEEGSRPPAVAAPRFGRAAACAVFFCAERAPRAKRRSAVAAERERERRAAGGPNEAAASEGGVGTDGDCTWPHGSTPMAGRTLYCATPLLQRYMELRGLLDEEGAGAERAAE